MANLAIIPARGGSKRIPRKNIKDFLGKPIIAYSIEVALKSNLFEEVIVSTDDEEIADISNKYGAEILMRSGKNSDDFATLSDVIEEVKTKYSDNTFSKICCILPTAPLLTSEILKKGYDCLVMNNADSVRPVIKFSYPIQRAYKLNNGKVDFFNEEYSNTRSQDLAPAFYDSGMFYWMEFKLGLKGKNKFAFEISELDAQDIDTLEDWKMAEFKYNLKHTL